MVPGMVESSCYIAILFRLWPFSIFDPSVEQRYHVTSRALRSRSFAMMAPKQTRRTGPCDQMEWGAPYGGGRDKSEEKKKPPGRLKVVSIEYN